MKKLNFAVLTGMALLSLGTGSCVSVPKLDLATVDFSKPMSVGIIIMHVYVKNGQATAMAGGEPCEFYNKNAVNGIFSEDLLLSAFCGTVAENMGYIEERFKAKTGIAIKLNGDEFMRELKDGDTRGIAAPQEGKILGMTMWTYQWRITDHENPDAIIQLTEKDGKLVPASISINKADAMGNTESYYHVNLMTR
jgi:hypothetical protein